MSRGLSPGGGAPRKGVAEGWRQRWPSSRRSGFPWSRVGWEPGPALRGAGRGKVNSVTQMAGIWRVVVDPLPKSESCPFCGRLCTVDAKDRGAYRLSGPYRMAHLVRCDQAVRQQQGSAIWYVRREDEGPDERLLGRGVTH